MSGDGKWCCFETEGNKTESYAIAATLLGAGCEVRIVRGVPLSGPFAPIAGSPRSTGVPTHGIAWIPVLLEMRLARSTLPKAASWCGVLH